MKGVTYGPSHYRERLLFMRGELYIGERGDRHLSEVNCTPTKNENPTGRSSDPMCLTWDFIPYVTTLVKLNRSVWPGYFLWTEDIPNNRTSILAYKWF